MRSSLGLLAAFTSVGCVAPTDASDPEPGSTSSTDAASSSGGGSGGSSDGGVSTSSSTTALDESSSGLGDASSSSTGDELPPPEGVPMFVALGQGARTVVSCDGGVSWVGEQAVVDDNDDHGLYSSRGLTWGGGVFLAGVGWGNPGTVRRSEDGVNWTQTLPAPDGEPLPSGLVDVAWGHGVFVAIEGRRTYWSDDLGLTWERRGDVPSFDNLRIAGFSDFEEGRFYAAGDLGQIFYTADQGQTWVAPESVGGGGCENGNLTRRGGIVDGDGVVVIATDAGLACRSDDGGLSFTVHALAENAASNPVWTPDGFYVAGGGQGMSSPDGLTWSADPLAPADAAIQRVAVDPSTGIYVGIARDGDRFYRSEDGVAWTQLSEEDTPAGNDLTQLVFGYGSPSGVCPG